MKLIVSDTGPLLHLKEAGILDLLARAGSIYISPTVDLEMGNLLPDWGKPGWITIEPLSPEEAIRVESLFDSRMLHLGEAEAVLLAKRLGCDWFLTDDTAARIFAGSLGMEVHGSLGIVLWSAAVGHLNHMQAKAALAGLADSSLWISPWRHFAVGLADGGELI